MAQIFSDIRYVILVINIGLTSVPPTIS